jgi:hypothetical protein
VRALHCLDPPIVTTGFLRSRGYGEYEVRRLWRYARRLHALRYPLYVYEDSLLTLRLVVRQGPAYHYARTMTPVDRVDCEVLGGECRVSTRSYGLYSYIEGHVEGNSVRLNLAHLAVLAARAKPRLVLEILGHALNFVEPPSNMADRIGELMNVLAKLSRLVEEYYTVIDNALPRAPRSLDELLHLSPIIRYVYSIL